MSDNLKLKNNYDEAVHKLQRKIDDLNSHLEVLLRDLKFRDETIIVKTFREERLAQNLHIVQEHYKAIKKEVLILKEDNRILNSKLESVNAKFKTDSRGNIILDGTNKKIKPKDQGFVIKHLNNDPVLSKIEILVEKPNLSEEIANNEKNEESLFKTQDYIDK